MHHPRCYGCEEKLIGPAKGIKAQSTIPLDGTIKPNNYYLPIPLDGNHLEVPSILRN